MHSLMPTESLQFTNIASRLSYASTSLMFFFSLYPLQITVALYVFCISWSPSADKRLLGAAVVLFILGVFKCFEKPLALKRSSFNSLVSSFQPSPKTETTNREVELEQYIQEARDSIHQNQDPPTLDSERHLKQLSRPNRLFVDFAYAYHDRLSLLKSLWLLDGEAAYKALREGLSSTFNIIYCRVWQGQDQNYTPEVWGNCCSVLLCPFTVLLPIVPIGLFHSSNKGAYARIDINITYLLLYITYMLEILSWITLLKFYSQWSDMVAQHNLIGFFIHEKSRTCIVRITEWLQCKGLGDQYSCLKPCHSSREIASLVRDHVKDGWMYYISDVESYWRFSDIRGHWSLKRYGCEGNEGIIRGSIEKPFDESIILWHVATDFCFHRTSTSHYKYVRLCRQISNYMMHLLFANPEMLMPGSRKKLFTIAYRELESILEGDDLPLSDEKNLAEDIIDSVARSKDGFVYEAWVLARELMQIEDVKKRWDIIRGVWIEMLCFSASRCRGYLHAKSLGSGGEYLTFVSLLMSHAGLETFLERQQRVQLQLPKEERVKIAKQRIQEEASKQAAGGPSTPEATAPMKEEEKTATPSSSEVIQPLKDEENAATTLSPQDGYVAPAPTVIKIVVSP